VYYNYIKENNTLYTIKYINGDWYEINFNKDGKFYTKNSLRLQREDGRHPKNWEYKLWKDQRTCEKEASTLSNLITSSEQTNILEELPTQTSTLDDTLADTFLANLVFEDIAEDTEIQQLYEHYLPTTIPPPCLRFANMVDPITNPRSAHNNPRPMALFTKASEQINQDAFTGLNPDAIQYLLQALNQYTRIPGSNLEQLQPQENPPTNQCAETEGGLKGHMPKPFAGKRPRVKPSSSPSSVVKRLKVLMGSMMGRSDERSRSGYDGLIQSLMESVIDGKCSRSSHQGLMRSLMEISD